MQSNGPIISFQSVMLRYENGAKALRNIDLNIYPASFQYITGISGSGKTSILRLINLDVMPTAGTIKIFGKDVIEMTDTETDYAKREIGFVFQDMNLIDSMSIVENVALPLKIRGIPKLERGHRALEILDWLGIGKNRNDRPSYLACGQRQCVAIARAIIAKPKIILADDPISYLDARAANKVISLLFELSKNDTCVLITNGNDQKLPQLVKHAREIKITSGMLLDNVLATNKKEELPIAM